MTLLISTKSAWAAAQAVPPFPVSRFTVEQYHRMIESGAFAQNERVELLRGWITPKMPHNPPHDSTVTRSHRQLRARLGDAWSIRTQCSITLADSEPEPDLAVAVGPDERYDDHHPGPDELFLVIEVADSTLWHDRRTKAAIYAAAGIRVYWIINVSARQVEVYTDPDNPAADPAFRSHRVYDEDDAVPLVGFDPTPDPIRVREMLPALAKTT